MYTIQVSPARSGFTAALATQRLVELGMFKTHGAFVLHVQNVQLALLEQGATELTVDTYCTTLRALGHVLPEFAS